MKKKYLLLAWLVGCVIFCNGQDPALLNKYRFVYVLPLDYPGGKSDIYGIRRAAIEKLTGCGIPLFTEEKKISVEAKKNPCSLLHCIVNNMNSGGDKNTSLVYVLLLNCRNDTVFYNTEKAKLFSTFSETCNSFVDAAKKAMQVFSNFHHEFSGADSSLAPGHSEEAFGDSIPWSPERKLTWNDFKGTANDTDPSDALTYTRNETRFESFGIGDRMEVESQITCYFIKEKSWVKSGKQGEYLLNHEQRHFDLAEAGAREFKKKLKKIHFTAANFNGEIKRLTKETNDKYSDLQKQYDEETNHSRIEEMQKKWNLKIDTMLRELEDYK
jgi:hypothetical protein